MKNPLFFKLFHLNPEEFFKPNYMLMKKSLLLLAYAFGEFAFAQLQPFTNPEFGKFQPRFQHQGYLIGNRFTKNPTTGNYDVWNGIHKLNLSNGETTQFSFGQSGTFVMPTQVDSRNIYQDNIYINVGTNGFRKANLIENHIYDYLHVNAIPIQGTVFGNRVYFNFYTNATYYYDLATEKLILLSDHPTGGIIYGNFLAAGSNMYAIKHLPPEQGLLQGSRLLRFNSSYNIAEYIESRLTSEGVGDYISSMTAFTPNGRLTINGKEIYMALVHSGGMRLLAIDTGNFQSTKFISEKISINMQSELNYITLPDGVIFSYGGNFYKTNGNTTLEQVNTLNNIGGFDNNFHTPSSYNNWINSFGNSFVKIGQTTYFLVYNYDEQTQKIYKISSIEATPELVYTGKRNAATHVSETIRYATEWKGNLIFTTHSNDSTVSDKIFLYNGSELIVNPNLNTYAEKTAETSPVITGLVSHDDLLVVNTEKGVYSIDYDKLSLSDEAKSTALKVYPNPVKDILHFSEEVSNVKVTDLSGRMVKETSVKGNSVNISLLTKGDYIVTVIAKSGKVISTKIMKE